jgi:hypothetical protein
MKRTALLILAFALVGSLVFGQTQVLSRNAVGYVKITIPRGSLMMIQTPFESLDGVTSVNIGELIGSNVPNGTTAYFWKQGAQAYGSEGFVSGFGWVPGTQTFIRGQGMFLKIPAGAPSNSYDIFMMGEVPDRFTAPTSQLTFVQGLQMVGYMYPTETPLTNSMLSNIASNGDTLYYWKTNQQWGSEGYVAGFGWVPGTLVLKPGESYYYKAKGANVWSEAKPYTWP